MADFNQILAPGDVDNGVVNVVVEIPQGSNHKIEWNRDLAVMQLDRVEPAYWSLWMTMKSTIRLLLCRQTTATPATRLIR